MLISLDDLKKHNSFYYGIRQMVAPSDKPEPFSYWATLRDCNGVYVFTDAEITRLLPREWLWDLRVLMISSSLMESSEMVSKMVSYYKDPARGTKDWCCRHISTKEFMTVRKLFDLYETSFLNLPGHVNWRDTMIAKERYEQVGRDSQEGT